MIFHCEYSGHLLFLGLYSEQDATIMTHGGSSKTTTCIALYQPQVMDRVSGIVNRTIAIHFIIQCGFHCIAMIIRVR